MNAYLKASPTFDGAVTLGAGQLVIPVTQSASVNANTLDDSEEGTWTPTRWRINRERHRRWALHQSRHTGSFTIVLTWGTTTSASGTFTFTTVLTLPADAVQRQLRRRQAMQVHPRMVGAPRINRQRLLAA